MDDCLIRIRRYLPSGRRTRHTAALLSVTIMTTIGMVVAGKAPSALACDINNHCYAVSSAVGADNYGVGATISISCLYAPNSYPNFLTNELWDASGNEQYWVEAGAISGYGYNNQNYYSRELFWEDSRPNGGSIHFHPVEAVNPANYYVAVTWAGNNTWDVDVNGNQYASTSQPMFSGGAVTLAGTEYTFNQGNGMRDIGHVYDVEWRSANGNWHPQNASMGADLPSGPSAYITPTYDASTSSVSWTGPC